MSSLAHPLVTWAEFLHLPSPEDAQHYELHDGEVVVVPPARSRHVMLQTQIEHLLEALFGTQGIVRVEFPYRPLVNLQFWVADVAYIPKSDWRELARGDYPVFAPPLVIEVLSPSNRPAKISRQRIVAMSAGTQEFWVVDEKERTVEVTTLSGWRTYGAGESITLSFFDGAIIVDDLFAIDEI